MNKLKKGFITLIAGVLSLSSVMGLTACGGGGPDYSKEVPVEAYDGSAVTVTFHHTMGQDLQEKLNDAIEAFNELYPNITIEHKKAAANYDALRNDLATKLTQKETPTIATCYPDHVALYNKTKSVVALDDYASSTATVSHADGTTETLGFTTDQLNDFIPAFYNEGKSYGDGKMYTLPLCKSTEVMFYNKTFFDTNNLTVPTTWEEMATVCEQIINIEKARVQANGLDPNDKKNLKVYPFGYDSESNWFITLAEQYGSEYTTAEGDEHFTFNNETNRKFVEMLRGWYDKGYFTTKALYNNYTSNLFIATGENLKCYMCIGSTGGSSYQVGELNGGEYDFEIGVAPIPQVSMDNKKVIQQGPSVCIFKKENPQEVAAAWLFLKHCTTSVSYQGGVSTVNGYTPVIKSVQTDSAYKAWLTLADNVEGKAKNAYLQATTVKLALEQMDNYFVSDVFEGSSDARDQVGLLMQNCFVNDLGGKSVADFIKDKFDEVMDTLKYEY